MVQHLPVDCLSGMTQRQFAQGREIAFAEKVLHRSLGLLRYVDLAFLQAPEQFFRSATVYLVLPYLVCGPDWYLFWWQPAQAGRCAGYAQVAWSVFVVWQPLQVGFVPVWSPGYSVEVCLWVSGVQAGYLWHTEQSFAVCM